MDALRMADILRRKRKAQEKYQAHLLSEYKYLLRQNRGRIEDIINARQACIKAGVKL